MPTLGTQNIATSYPQLLKVASTSPISGSLQAITSGDSSGTSALSLSTSEVQSTGSFTVSSNSRLLGPVTFGSTITAATGTITIGTLSNSTSSIGTATISTATISTATIPLQLGAVTFGSHVTISTGTATIGTLSCSTASIGTESVGTVFGTVGSFSGQFTTGSLKVGASGSTLTSMTYTTTAFTGATILDINTATNGNNISTGTFTMTGIGNSDIILGGLTSLAGASGGTPGGLLLSLRTEATNVARYTILNCSSNTASTIGTGILHASAFRYI